MRYPPLGVGGGTFDRRKWCTEPTMISRSALLHASRAENIFRLTGFDDTWNIMVKFSAHTVFWCRRTPCQTACTVHRLARIRYDMSCRRRDSSWPFYGTYWKAALNLLFFFLWFYTFFTDVLRLGYRGTYVQTLFSWNSYFLRKARTFRTCSFGDNVSTRINFGTAEKFRFLPLVQSNACREILSL